jgi:hypothetical protein
MGDGSVAGLVTGRELADELQRKKAEDEERR